MFCNTRSSPCTCFATCVQTLVQLLQQASKPSSSFYNKRPIPRPAFTTSVQGLSRGRPCFATIVHVFRSASKVQVFQVQVLQRCVQIFQKVVQVLQQKMLAPDFSSRFSRKIVQSSKVQGMQLPQILQ